MVVVVVFVVGGLVVVLVVSLFKVACGFERDGRDGVVAVKNAVERASTFSFSFFSSSFFSNHNN